jgi:ATP-dependent protease ClpP protease subunit
MKSATLHINGKIGEKQQINALLQDDGLTFSANDCRNFLKENKDAEEIVAEISSDGGSTSQGFEIYDLLKNSGKKIKTIAYKTNSIASVIQLAAPIENRFVSTSGGGYIHNAWMSPQALAHVQLNSVELGKLKEETDAMDNKLLNLYCSELGEDKREALKNYMAQEKFLDASLMMELGFASAIYSPTVNIAIPDLILNHITKNKMSEQKEESFWRKSMSEKIDTILNSMKKPEAVNLIEGTTKEGQAVVVEAEEGEDWLGKTIYIVDADGNQSPATDGEHTFEDGTKVTVAEGKIESVEKAPEEDEAMEALKAELETANAKNNELQNSLDEAKKVNEEAKESLQNLKKEVLAFKKSVPAPAEASQNIETPTTMRQAVLNMTRERKTN